MNAVTREYLLLFNSITDTEEALADLRDRLIAAQQRAEALFLEEGSDPPAPRCCNCQRQTKEFVVS